MTWIIASLPLWIAGGLLLTVGTYGIGAVAFHEGETPRFNSASDYFVLRMGFCMILASAPLLFAAAKIAA